MADAHIDLNDDQRAAADELRAMLATPEAEALLIKGYAGTGKTSTLMTVLGERKDVLYLTPSHAAKNVIADALPRAANVVTLHSALGARMGTTREGEDFFTFDAHRLEKWLGEVSIVVLDECSMVGGGLFAMLFERLGLVDKTGARYLVRREVKVDLEDQATQERVTSLLYGHGVDALDAEHPRAVVGRPSCERLGADGWRYTWWVEGGKKMVKLIVMGDPAQLPPVYGSERPEGDDAWWRDIDLKWALDHDLTECREVRGEVMRGVIPHDSPAFDARYYNRRCELTRIMRASDAELLRVNLSARDGALRARPFLVGRSATSPAIEHLDNRLIIHRATDLYRAQADVVVLCWRNAVKDQIARAIRTELLGPGADVDVLHVGEPAMLRAPYQAAPVGAGEPVHFHNGDLLYILTSEPAHYTSDEFPALSGPYRLYSVKRARDGIRAWVKALPASGAKQFARAGAEIRMDLNRQIEAAEARMRVEPEAGVELARTVALLDERLARLSEVQRQFAAIESSYTRTCHKAQGGSWDTVIYNQEDVSSCRSNRDRAKLAYVAVSRARRLLIVTH